MKEDIGGYFELESLINRPYHRNVVKLNSARNCLVYLIKSKKIKKIYIPYYLCDSVDVIFDYCKVEYYEINSDFLPKFSKKLNENEYLYIVNYYGMIGKNDVKKLKEKYNNIILDNVQAFFQYPNREVDTIYSCRKFLGVPDGAYLYTSAKMQGKLEKEESGNRVSHIFGRLERTSQEYFNVYRENEEAISKSSLKYMSETTNALLGAFNYKKIKETRTKNYKYLRKKLNEMNMIKPKNIIGAFAYPFYTSNATELRKKLISNKVFVPTLWPNVLENCKDKIAYNYALNIIPLPCDQRYGKEEMDKIISIIKETNY